MTPYPYRCPFRQPCDESCAEAFAQDLEDVISTTTNGRPAAFIAESILGVGGYIVPPPGYFARAAEIIRSYGGLFIADEVQSGFGRTGRRWFGIEHWGVEPDIMVMAKGIANGSPVGATVARPEIADAWIGLRLQRYNALRILSIPEGKSPGPEAMITKIFWATWHRNLGKLAMDVLGAEGEIASGAAEGNDAAYPLTRLQRMYLFSR